MFVCKCFRFGPVENFVVWKGVNLFRGLRIKWIHTIGIGFASFVYLSTLPVAHLIDAPRRRLVFYGDSAGIQDEATESSAWFFVQIPFIYRRDRLPI